MQPTVVAFDVDGTLTVRDCVVPFMRQVAGPGAFGAQLLTVGASSIGSIVRRDRDAVKSEFVRRVFEGRSVEEVHDKGVRFASRIAGSWMRSDVASRMRWHQEQGHVVLLVSASLNPYLEPLGDMCEVDAVLCTTLEVDGDVHTGRIVGMNCRAHEKVRRIREWGQSSGVSVDSLEWAYGDSAGDTAMLDIAVNAVKVSRRDIGTVPE